MTTLNNAGDVAAALELRINSGNLPPGCLHRETAVIKKGPQAYKTATLWFFGDRTTGELKRRKLCVQSWNARADRGGFAFEEKAASWSCENAEIDAFLAFLSGNLGESGVYHRIDADSPLASVVEKVQSGEADAGQLEAIAQALADAPNATEVLARHHAGRVLLAGIQSAQQRDVVEKLKVAVNDPATKEPALQKILDDGWWMFGGRFIAREERRAFTVLDQIDIPLIRADGALHIVELKRANITNLVVKYRNHYVVGPGVNESVGQVTNYLRELDEQRHTIKNTLGIECRRAFATVVIGHPQYVNGLAEDLVSETLRTYNSHLARVEVITYADLIQGAEGALGLQGEVRL